ncbi:MAG: acyl-CoA/acyl-ACP dehydrogenase [Gammaproteobacteria bacterium]|nr:acyl-CoA/acyl-ACP dehydrogenase [Gammaproteobacteria bacterium]MBU1602352.1 acyl-CoA/acyl-ACP dehydrogenase [Gammaproteobacteria bacterium]MBU2433158.1 acyl-CoA/acyl-ACP dehydrogenase [Gammaproteobacteria bacterium]MBU2451073.1 acyl-CoA/acyl-ACP dehydrogenase [Gammaproteobacteria bacterium]
MPSSALAVPVADQLIRDYSLSLCASEESLAAVREVIAAQLKPKVLDIDLKAEYPEEFLRALGRAGGFRGAVDAEFGGNDLGLKHVIQVMEEVSKECMSSGFLVWCQTACARYIQLSDNAWVKKEFLPRIAAGELLVGTGLSNTIKSCDNIEEYRLSAKRVEGGYIVNGVLPWVSNLGPDHYFTTGCPVRNEDGSNDGLVFILVDCQQAGFKLVDCAHFIGLDGTRTLACQFKEVFIPDNMVLAQPDESAAYVKRIKPGMILAQMGMGLGLIDACSKLMAQSNRTLAHVNQYLDDQFEDIESALEEGRAATYALADEVQQGPVADRTLDILKLRLAGGELSVRAAHAAMLHQGAKGYLVRNAAQRRLREAYFVAIVTPATKHLRREIARIEDGLSCTA